MMQNISETQVLGLSQLSWLENVAFFFFFFTLKVNFREKKYLRLLWGPSSNWSFCLGDDE